MKGSGGKKRSSAVSDDILEFSYSFSFYSGKKMFMLCRLIFFSTITVCFSYFMKKLAIFL